MVTRPDAVSITVRVPSDAAELIAVDNERGGRRRRDKVRREGGSRGRSGVLAAAAADDPSLLASNVIRAATGRRLRGRAVEGEHVGGFIEEQAVAEAIRVSAALKVTGATIKGILIG